MVYSNVVFVAHLDGWHRESGIKGLFQMQYSWHIYPADTGFGHII